MDRDEVEVLRRSSSATSASWRAETTPTTSVPATAAKAGATTLAPNPVPITPTRTGVTIEGGDVGRRATQGPSRGGDLVGCWVLRLVSGR